MHQKQTNYPRDGCPHLNQAGIPVNQVGFYFGRDKDVVIQNQRGIDVCTECLEPRCVFDSDRDRKKVKHLEIKYLELYDIEIQCRGCGTMETVQIAKGQSVNNSHWFQKGNVIEHRVNCGEARILSIKQVNYATY